MNINKHLKDLYSNFIKAEFTDTLMEKTHISYQHRIIYDDDLLAKTVSMFELTEVLTTLPKSGQAIILKAPFDDKLSKLLRTIIMVTEEKPDCIYVNFELPDQVSLERTVQMFENFEDACSETWHDEKECNLVYTSRYTMAKKAKIFMLMYFN